MEQPIVEITALPQGEPDPSWIAALEAGKVLYFPKLAFTPTAEELRLFDPAIRTPKSRNISFDADDALGGTSADEEARQVLAGMMRRFRTQSEQLLATLAPRYQARMKRGPVTFRPSLVETRAQSWRADDRRLHVDALASRPNRGERLLRVFTNVNPDGKPRVWRVGEPFEHMAGRFLPRAKAYSAWRAHVLHRLGVTTSLRSEYDHLMLQLHDGMKLDLHYQQNAPQVSVAFPAGATWVCFSDQTSHAAMSGQYLLEQTVQLPPAVLYEPDSSPLAILSRLTGKRLCGECGRH